MTDTAMADETRRRIDNGLDKGHGNDNGKGKEPRKEYENRVYLKEATVTVDVTSVQDGRAADIIKAVTEQIGDGKILAVRPKQGKRYEITLESEEDMEPLMEGLIIKGQRLEVNKLWNRDYVVSFMHLPVYIADDKILDKLDGWGVSPISKIKRRVYPGTTIEDGTRFVRARFPKEVASLPYSTKIETAEGPQYFRVMHSNQVKTCRLCMSPDHVVKECPEFVCFKCEERGHFARDCNAVTCPDCKKTLNKCECWMEDEEGNQRIDGQMHEQSNEKQEEEGEMIQAEEPKSNNTEQQQEESNNNKDILTQQDGGVWTQIDMTDSLQCALETVERTDVQEEGNKWTQLDLTDSLQMQLDVVECNDHNIKENSAAKEKEETQAKLPKRRRSVKVTPNVETARKKVSTADGIEYV